MYREREREIHIYTCICTPQLTTATAVVGIVSVVAMTPSDSIFVPASACSFHICCYACRQAAFLCSAFADALLFR